MWCIVAVRTDRKRKKKLREEGDIEELTDDEETLVDELVRAREEAVLMEDEQALLVSFDVWCFEYGVCKMGIWLMVYGMWCGIIMYVYVRLVYGRPICCMEGGVC